jgi:hypothetical protein
MFIGPFMDCCFESAAIAHFFPHVAKVDFKQMTCVLHLHLLTDYNINNLDIHSCCFGEAFVGFNSPLERHRFLDGPPLYLDGYLVHFEKHDESVNARCLELDREVWLMLLGCPLDA